MAVSRDPGLGPPLAVVREGADLRRRVADWRAEGRSIALVPTMGAIHAGHAALIQRARSAAERVVASLFVNPLQFSPHEDFQAYPRDEARDVRAFEEAGVDLVYAPEAETMFPPDFATRISLPDLSRTLCGPFRPGHFEGVATVVAKLLLQAQPDVAVFGEKDYQQLVLVRRLARDLDIPCAILGVATVREADGLALSSRNVYLCAPERRIAPALHRTLEATAAALARGEEAAAALKAAREKLLQAGFDAVDYVALCDGETLAPLPRAKEGARLLAAARLGATRLIDNLELKA